MSYCTEHISSGLIGLCPNEDDGTKVEKILRFKRENIIESIRVIAGIIANGQRDTAMTDEVKHHIDDIAEGGNMDRLNEVIDIAILECMEICEKICTLCKVNDNEIVDNYTLRDEWAIRLSLPGKTHEHTAHLIGKYIHELVCIIAIEDYLGLIGVSAANVLEDRIENMLDKIGKAIRGKKRTTRPMTII